MREKEGEGTDECRGVMGEQMEREHRRIEEGRKRRCNLAGSAEWPF